MTWSVRTLGTTALAISLLSTPSFAKNIKTTDLLQNMPSGPHDKKKLQATKTVLFNQTASGGTDAGQITKLRLSYFASSDCSGTASGTDTGSLPSPSFTTSTGSPFTIAVGTDFGINADAVWNTGRNSGLSISEVDMTNINSIAVTFMADSNNVPQATFQTTGNDNISYACINVSCSAISSECTSSDSTKSFTLKTSAAIGDVANGGVIGCIDAEEPLLNVIFTTEDNGSGQAWGDLGDSVTTTALDGETNTANIIASNPSVSPYAAKTCDDLIIDGGFNAWFLGSGENDASSSQIGCLNTNRSEFNTGALAAGGTALSGNYWTSTQNASNTDRAWRLGGSTLNARSKNSLILARCAQTF